MHSNQTPSVSISRIVSNRSISLDENIPIEDFSLGIQYDTGCQISLLFQSALQTLPPSMYSRGTSFRVKVMTYTGKGKIILTTEIKLKLHWKILTLLAIEEDLNSSSGFSFSVSPNKWRKLTDLGPHQSDLHLAGWRQQPLLPY